MRSFGPRSLRLLLVGAVVAAELTSFQPRMLDTILHASAKPKSAHVTGHALANSPKPDWRGDLANTGRELNATGPATLPQQVFSTTLAANGNTLGLSLAADGSVLTALSSGTVYALKPDGTQKWAYALNPLGSFGSDANASGSNPVAGDDGADYIGSDNGNVYQINHATGVGASIWANPTSRGVTTTPKLGPNNVLYVGTADGKLVAFTLPTVGSGQQATQIYRFSATGSDTTQCPCKFYGEPALDGNGNIYAASTDTNAGEGGLLATLYAIDPTGHQIWSTPPSLLGQVDGAILLVPNPSNPAQMLVIVADRGREVAAFDASNGNRVWQYKSSTGYFLASPTLSKDGTTLFVADTGPFLIALDLATGMPRASFGSAGTGMVPLTTSVKVSPILDAAGNLFLMEGSGALDVFSGTGTLLYSIPRGEGGIANVTGYWMSPAIGSDGTLYLAGTSAIVQALRVSAGPPFTPTVSPTITPTQN